MPKEYTWRDRLMLEGANPLLVDKVASIDDKAYRLLRECIGDLEFNLIDVLLVSALSFSKRATPEEITRMFGGQSNE